MEISQRVGDYYGDATSNHVFEITDESGVAAELYVSTDRHEIMNIEVREDRRGEGLARALYTAASCVMDICHAPVAHRTEEGHAFAQAVGGATITYPCDCAGCDTSDDDMED
jgi:hypothetical protein